jgi:hypothetical protein
VEIRDLLSGPGNLRFIRRRIYGDIELPMTTRVTRHFVPHGTSYEVPPATPLVLPPLLKPGRFRIPDEYTGAERERRDAQDVQDAQDARRAQQDTPVDRMPEERNGDNAASPGPGAVPFRKTCSRTVLTELETALIYLNQMKLDAEFGPFRGDCQKWD